MTGRLPNHGFEVRCPVFMDCFNHPRTRSSWRAKMLKRR